MLFSEPLACPMIMIKSRSQRRTITIIWLKLGTGPAQYFQLDNRTAPAHPLPDGRRVRVRREVQGTWQQVQIDNHKIVDNKPLYYASLI